MIPISPPFCYHIPITKLKGAISLRKTAIITFRTDRKTKERLDNLAEYRKWTLSFLVEEAVKAYLRSHPSCHSETEPQSKTG